MKDSQKSPFAIDPSAESKSHLPNEEQKLMATEQYRHSLPDVQNAPSTEIMGANVPILQTGISNFRLPLSILREKNETLKIEVSVTGSVSVAAETKGINMSRIMRTFYVFKDRVFTLELLEEILLRYKADLGSSRACLRLSFSYPILQKSLRSDLEGYQYYEVVYEGILDDLDRFRKRIHFDFVYSSACPSSSELAEHSRQTRNVYAIPHSQRSKARLSVEVRPGALLCIEDLLRHCRKALPTETQVMVRRDDEQAFAEMNGEQPKFVEDAVRLVYEQLQGDDRMVDFQIACAHLESLHSHDAVAVMNKGAPGGFTGHVEDFGSLVC